LSRKKLKKNKKNNENRTVPDFNYLDMRGFEYLNRGGVKK